MKALVDLTAAVPGTVPNLLQQISSGSVGNHSLTLLCYVGQLGVQRALVGTAKLVEVPAECNLIEEVKSWIANPEHGDSDLIVCSFRPEVWALQYVPVLGGLSRKVEFPTWRPFLSLSLGVTVLFIGNRSECSLLRHRFQRRRRDAIGAHGRLVSCRNMFAVMLQQGLSITHGYRLDVLDLP